MKINQILRLTAFLACVTLVLASSACSDDKQSPAYGELDESAESPGGFNLADIQPDWSPNPAKGQIDQAPLFNRSISDERVVGGDERRFFAVRKWNEDAKPAKFQRTMQLEVGGQYQGYVYFHNTGNGADHYTSSTNTRVSLMMPRYLEHKTRATAELGSQNSSPNTISSSVVLSVAPGSPPVLIDIVQAFVVMREESSASYSVPVSELQNRAGAEIGCNEKNLPIAAGDQCWGQLLFIFKVHRAEFEVGADVGAYYGQGSYSLSNTVRVRKELNRLVVKVTLRNPLNVDLNWVELGHAVDAEGPFAIVRDDSWLLNESNDLGETRITLAEDDIVRVGLLKAEKTAVLRLNFNLANWDALCRDGQALLWVWAKVENSYRQAEKIRVFPEQC